MGLARKQHRRHPSILKPINAKRRIKLGRRPDRAIDRRVRAMAQHAHYEAISTNPAHVLRMSACVEGTQRNLNALGYR